MPWLWGLALTAAISQAGAAASPNADERIVNIRGYVGNSGTEPDDWFRLTGIDAKLLLPRGPERETHWSIIESAEATGVALQVRLDAVAGRIASTGNHVEYPVCSIAVANGAAFGDESRNCPPAAAAENEAERLLALGLVRTQQQPETARRLLGAALMAAPPLPPLAQALAHKARADAAEELSFTLDPLSPQHDRLMTEALADYRRLVELLPERAGPQLAIGEALVALGGYQEALNVYRDVGRRWPDSAFDVAVQTGALYRQQGEYAQALRALDEFARGGDSDGFGMRFRYHRAWTLVLLERYEEAVRELDQGLELQPDYSSAYQLRSCALARLGRLEPALADQRRALELMGAEEAEQGHWARAASLHSRNAIRALETAIAEGRSGQPAARCEELWERWQRPRPRSPLLAADG